MTSLSGSFQTDLPRPDALTACTDAIEGIGWEIESVEAGRIAAYAGSRAEGSPKMEVELSESQRGTDIQITGSETEANPLGEAELIPELDRLRDAIERSVERTPQSETRAPQTQPLPAAGSAQQQSWLQRHWRGPVIGLVAFVAGAGLAAAGAETETTTVQRTTTETTQGPVTTQTQTETQTRTVTETAESPSPAPASPSSSASSGCDPNYSGCVPPYPPDTDCADVGGPVTVIGSDPHGLDADGDGSACE